MPKLLILFFLLINLYAYKGFNGSFAKLKDSSFFLGLYKPVAITKYYGVLYSDKKLNIKYDLYDPFLGLYRIKHKNKYYFKFFKKKPKKLAFISSMRIKKGVFLKEQIGLDNLAIFSKKSLVNSIVTDYCCGIYGFGIGGNEVIDKDYLQRFLNLKKVSYTDLGFDIFLKGKGIFIKYINPFIDSPLEVNDQILKHNGKKIKSASKFLKNILFSKLGSKHKITYKREGSIDSAYIIGQKKLAGGLIKQSFLENIGIYLSDNLQIQTLIENSLASNFGLKKNDKIFMINSKIVKNHKDIKKLLSNLKKDETKLSFLIERKGFQFFLNLDRNFN